MIYLELCWHVRHTGLALGMPALLCMCLRVCMCVHASDVHDTTGLAHLQTIADHVRSWLLVVDGATDGQASKEYHW